MDEKLVKSANQAIKIWSKEKTKLIVAIDGYTGVGKTTLLDNLVKLNPDILAVSRDDFMLPRKIFHKKLDSSEDKSKLFLVEIKYQTELNIEKLKEYASKLIIKWDCPWLFVVTPKGFYCGMSDWILNENSINELSENWVIKERQIQYLRLLKEFER